ncbi:MAG: hypothetical protein EP343_26560 [Deltaproteobacteria bacterium]|nr:MAG: hypothetical protein EP343_26560 [Deltaproteobacteria bacterium]
MSRLIWKAGCFAAVCGVLWCGAFLGCSQPTTQGSESSTSDGSTAQGNEKDSTEAPQTQDSSLPDSPEVKEEAPEEPAVKRFSFPGEEVKCEANANLEKLKSILAGGKNNPTGRGEQASGYDPCNQRIILFGGNDLQPQQCADFGPTGYKADTWIYVAEYKNWVRLQTENTPPARGRQASAFDLSRKKLYIFGGRFRANQSGGLYTMYNDLWAFNVNNDQWEKVAVTGTERPLPRANSAMVYDYVNDQLILFGGNSSNNGLNFNALNDTYAFDLKRLKWRKVQTKAAPPVSIFHNMVMDGANKRVLLYGGGGNNAFVGPFYKDVWAFDLDQETWTKVWSPSAQNPGPPARINSALVEDKDNKRTIMFAGHDDTSVGHRNDVWVFDNTTNKWSQQRDGDTGTGQGCPRFCACSPDFVTVDKTSPERREYHTFVPVIGEGRALMFGGKTDCGYIDDTWSLDLGSFQWTKINDASKGEACKRTGRANCTELCY